MSDCRRVADEINAGVLSDDELGAIFEELQRERTKRAAKDTLRSLEEEMFDAAEQMAADLETAAKIEARNRKINIIREADLTARAEAALAATGDVSMGLESAMVGVNAPFAGSRASVDAKANGALRMLLGGMVSDMRKAGLLPKFNSRAYEQDIARELWDMSLAKPTGKATASKDAKAMAAIINKYRRAAIERENRAGAYIRYKQGYVTRQSHDPHKMRRQGYDAWSQEVAPRLDWDAMNIDGAKRGAFLRSVYDAQVTGVRLSTRPDESDMAFAFKGPGNLAKKESQHRVLLFKDADAWLGYNERFGKASLNESILSDFRSSAQATALMDTFGTNPRAMFDKVRDKLKEKHRSDVRQVDRLNRRTLEWQFAEIDGTVNMPGNPTLAAIGRTTRAVQSMAKLGGAFISSITDLAATASERRYQGRSLGEMWMDALNAPFEGLTTRGAKRETAELIGTGIDGLLGDFVSRFAAQDDAPGRVSKLMSLYFKLNLLGPWTDAVKRGTGLMMARDLAMKGDWASLDVPTKRLLGMYGLDEARWAYAKQAVVEVDGRAYLVPDALPDATDRAGKQMRDEVSMALSSYYADRADFASPTPGARERALMRMGSQPGTPQGEAWRFLMQFKSFPITINQKVLGRDIYGYGARTMKDALLKGEGDRLGIAAYIAASTVLGLFALQAKEMAKGREPREINADVMKAAFLQGGGLGIYGDFLLGQTNRFGNSLLDTAAGPTFGLIADADKIRSKAMAGEDVWAEMLSLARANTPFANLFYTKTALDYLVFFQLQEMANPGYLRRHERNIKRNNNQQYFLPPSRAIPHGGGSRPLEGVR